MLITTGSDVFYTLPNERAFLVFKGEGEVLRLDDSDYTVNAVSLTSALGSDAKFEVFANGQGSSNVLSLTKIL